MSGLNLYLTYTLRLTDCDEFLLLLLEVVGKIACLQGPQKLSFLRRLTLQCPLYERDFKRGATVFLKS